MNTVTVSVPNDMSENDIRQAANIHYINVVKINSPKPGFNCKTVEVEYEDHAVSQIFHFGKNIGQRIVWNANEKEAKKKKKKGAEV